MASELSRLDVYYCEPCQRIILMSDHQEDWEVIEFKKKFYIHYVPGELKDSISEKPLGATADRTYLVYQGNKHASLDGYSKSGNYKIDIQFHGKTPGRAKTMYLAKHHGKLIDREFTAEIPQVS